MMIYYILSIITIKLYYYNEYNYIDKLMLDLYLILAPFYAAIILLDLIAFKLSLSDNTNTANL